MMDSNFNEMSKVKIEKELKHAIKFQGNIMPLDDQIIATRWAWDFDKEAMGYHAFLYRYLNNKCGLKAQITLAIISVDDYEGFERQAEAGAWAMGII